MMNQNICHFIPHHKDYQSIHTINYVLETLPQPYAPLKSQAVYKMYYVCSGSGFIHTLGKIQPLSEGDVFFTFPLFLSVSSRNPIFPICTSAFWEPEPI